MKAMLNPLYIQLADYQPIKPVMLISIFYYVKDRYKHDSIKSL